MDKQALRRQIRQQKRAMTPEEIEQISQRLGELFAASELYKNAKTIYGYLPYNQEVRTVPMLQKALDDEKDDKLTKELKNELESYQQNKPIREKSENWFK